MGDDIAVKLESVDQRTKSNTKRLERLEERQDNLDKLASSLASLTTEQEHIKDDVTEIKTDVKILTSKPAKRWEAFVGAAIGAIATAVIAVILARIGLS